VRRIYGSALVALVAALALSAGLANAALAAPEWYSSATPQVTEWQQGGAALTESVGTTSKGRVKLTEGSKAGLETIVECEVTGEGSVGPGSVDKETSVTVSSCTLVKAGGCEALRWVKAVNLPWHSELVGSGTTRRDVIVAEGKNPGFTFKCNTELGEVSDECGAKTLSANTENTFSGVNATYAGEKLSCSLGGKGAGTLEGTRLIEATKGATLEANTKTGTFAKITSALTVSATGKLAEENKEAQMGDTCNVETKGTIEAGGKGTITAYTSSGCEPLRQCSAIRGYLAINLPWKTELYESGGVVRDRIVNGGSGNPEYSFECKTGAGYLTVTCGLNVSPGLTNGLEGNVLATFGEGLTKTNCKGDTHEGEGLWLGELTIAHPSGVGAIRAQ
jgi:hypothetical protein